MADEGLKLRLFSTSTLECEATFQGPTHDAAIVEVLPMRQATPWQPSHAYAVKCVATNMQHAKSSMHSLFRFSLLSQAVGCRQKDKGVSFLLYRTQTQDMGIMAWPLSGHPDQYRPFLAHPGATAGFAAFPAACIIVTAGSDGVMHVWQV